MFIDWTGQTAYVVASGQSAADIVPHIPPAAPIIAVNRSFELVPHARALYAADVGFWQFYPAARDFAGIQICPNGAVKRVCPSVKVVRIHRDDNGLCMRMVREPSGVIGGGGNSAFQAINLAVQWGATRICLVGVDYCGNHWHPDHPAGLRNPNASQFRMWAKTLDAQAPLLASWGVEVLNLSPVSVLKAYPYADCRLLNPPTAALPA